MEKAQVFKKIVTATDFFEGSEAALTIAREIGRQNEAKLLVVHVLESSYSGIFRHFVKDFETGEEIVVSKEYEERARKELTEKWDASLRPYKNYDIEITVGVPWIEILKAARKGRADLVVLGSHAGKTEEKGVARLTGTVGSTVEGVVRGANCPVMIVNRMAPEKKLEFRRIMVCVDFSRSCEYGIEFANKMALAYGSELFMFHMFSVTPFLRHPQPMLEMEMNRSREKLQRTCKDMDERLSCHHQVWEGTLPYMEILKYAREKDVDLLVMGSHTRTSPEKWYVGGTVHDVSTRANCPVVVVTHPKSVLMAD